MPGGCNEVQQNVYTIVPEAGVTLDPGFFRKNIVVLAFEVTDDFAEAVMSMLAGEGVRWV